LSFHQPYQQQHYNARCSNLPHLYNFNHYNRNVNFLHLTKAAPLPAAFLK
jgi:hypothetical protein